MDASTSMPPSTTLEMVRPVLAGDRGKGVVRGRDLHGRGNIGVDFGGSFRFCFSQQ